MTKYLYIYTIGPVQSFIAQARKTQDIYAGSALLSHLITKAIVFLKQEFTEKYTVVFPSEDTISKPNRFMAIIEGESENIKKVLDSLNNSVKDTLNEIGKNAMSHLVLSESQKNEFRVQLHEHIETYWIALPFKEEEYADVYNEAERLLGAIKNNRSFVYTTEVGKKCFVSGERNGIISKTEVGGKGGKYLMKDNERLSAISFVKRTFSNYTFPSTAEIALQPFLDKLEIQEDKQNISNIISGEYQLLYPENLNETFFKKNGYEIDKIQKIKATLQSITNKHPKLNLSSYYAIVRFDGDDMGKWLSGKEHEAYFIKKENVKEYHLLLAKLLGDFSKEAQQISDKKGRTIFAGGDDFIAFVPLAYLLEVLVELRSKFKELVSDKIVNSNFLSEKSIQRELTFSAGVAIARYKSPLSITLKSAKEAEHVAKGISNKNTCCINILKGSGNSEQIVVKWDYENIATFKLLSQISTGLYTNFSNSLLSNVEERTAQLGGAYPDSEYFFNTIKYYLDRAYIGDKKEKEMHLKNMMALFLQLFSAIPYDVNNDKETLLDTLSLIQFLQRNQ